MSLYVNEGPSQIIFFPAHLRSFHGISVDLKVCRENDTNEMRINTDDDDEIYIVPKVFVWRSPFYVLTVGVVISVGWCRLIHWFPILCAMKNAESKATETPFIIGGRQRWNRTSSLLALIWKRPFFQLLFVCASLHRTQNECDDWKQMSNGKSLRAWERRQPHIMKKRHGMATRKIIYRFFLFLFFFLKSRGGDILYQSNSTVRKMAECFE